MSHTYTPRHARPIATVVGCGAASTLRILVRGACPDPLNLYPRHRGDRLDLATELGLSESTAGRLALVAPGASS